ncbi:LapA family protein [Cronbergia sp. UHCC 0137]|uniref:LapA family protein n=1 Tax=Cronbergia sp. UHCC 0137 TaxID=3110239 RepID=UPI002B20A362|nr:LapA family protein [Cronbergia sp. UHCC 0137]MEA5618397.1 LapA family protein [Cronbergia sp. UHCC 0137]
MALTRLILLVAVLGGITLLLVQNLSPVLPLVFLGMRTQALPYALWILLSIAAGAFTSILINTLFKFVNYSTGQTQVKSSKFTDSSPRVETTPRERGKSPPVSKTEYNTSNEFDDWETSPGENDDWNVPSNPSVDKNQSTPKGDSQSDSVYSYGYQEPKNTAVGKTESIYDADYRVIVPPHQPKTSNQDNDDDDWDFFEDDEFEDEQSNR